MLIFPLAFMIAFIFLKSRSGKNKAVPTPDDPGVKPNEKTKERNSEWRHSCTVKLINHSDQKFIEMVIALNLILEFSTDFPCDFCSLFKASTKKKNEGIILLVHRRHCYSSDPWCYIGPPMAKQHLGICFAVQHTHINVVHSVKFTSLKFVHRPYHASHIWLKMLSTHPWVVNHTSVFATTLLILVCLYSN